MPNQIINQISNPYITITSREIAELTGKLHHHVLRDIDNLVSELQPNLVAGFKSSTYIDNSGKSNRQYELDRDSTYCLMAGYDANSRMRIIKRWQELELAKQSQLLTLPQDYYADLLAFSTAMASLASTAKIWAEAAQNFSATAHALSENTRILAAKYAPCAQSPTQVAPSPQPKPQQALLPPLEAAFIQSWWNCLGSQTVTATDLYRAVATQQCQELNNSSNALLGEITLWTPKKLSYALRRWSQLTLDNFSVMNVGKSSHGTLWRLELILI